MAASFRSFARAVLKWALVAAIGALLVWTWPWWLIVLAGAIVFGIAMRWVNGRIRIARFLARHHGTDVRIVVFTSASAVWDPRIREVWLPRLGARALCVDRSSPDYSRGAFAFERDLLDHFARYQSREHTPAAWILTRSGRVVVLTFFRAFRDFKHGKPAALEALESRLFQEADSLAG